MYNFTELKDVQDLPSLLKKAISFKNDPLQETQVGKGRAMCLIFLNPSLRTRLSTQRAAINLGLDTVVFDMNQGGWKLEFADGTLMNGDKPEHIKEAAAVIGRYYDIIGIRAFAELNDQEDDYNELIINQFKKYAGVPVISLESAVRHPLQSLTDMITIESTKLSTKPKVVLSWAPHPKALPQAVANSFLEWSVAMNYNVVATHPPGYSLSSEFMQGVQIEYDQKRAFVDADYIYTKNWSSYEHYGQTPHVGNEWTINADKMKLTNRAKFMHCLPVRRNIIVSDEVIDSPQSLVIEQAANRVVAAQTVLSEILTSIKE